ncbi:hypothetical protein E2C01_048556 [Portunus trituberculatus]|uniref:Helix-turn-helix domain-containing protein n=1 Tax=Portunus trituberculatus TaxID=210409 RepID=A0A5B7GBG5_PORTR|nr:hypothetical protein [Portunus trituberculatus]
MESPWEALLKCFLPTFFTGTIEESILKNNKLHIYGCYVDDIFVCIKDQRQLQQLKQHQSEASILTFTHEVAVNGNLPFLDVLTTATNVGFITTVYTKPSNQGSCLNGKSECPQHYRNSTINAYIRCFLTHCSSWNNTHRELERITQVLINNRYGNTEVNDAIKNAINKWYKKEDPVKNDKILLCYKNIMSTEYKTDEHIIKDIIQHHVYKRRTHHFTHYIQHQENIIAADKEQNNYKKILPTRRPCHLQTHLQN